MRYATPIAIAALAIGTGLTSTARASDNDFKIPTRLSFSAASQKDTWNTVLIISAAVMVVGLIQEESTLTLLGGAGVLVSLFQTNKMGFSAPALPHGLDLVKSGPVSFGFSPFGQFGLASGVTTLNPSPYVVAKFKF